MRCTANCGVSRRETFVIRSGGRLVRSGVPRYRTPKKYRRPAAEQGTPRRDPLNADVIRGSIVARLCPGLQW